MIVIVQQFEYLKNSIQSIEDYLKSGIFFCDVISLLEDLKVYVFSIELLIECYKDVGIIKVVGIEVCGFLFGVLVVLVLGVGFVLVCKLCKLLCEIIVEIYELEYGIDQLEIYVDVIKLGDKVLVVDDLLVIGGIIDVMVKLICCFGGEVYDVVFIINFFDLGGEQCLEKLGIYCYSLVLFLGY